MKAVDNLKVWHEWGRDASCVERSRNETGQAKAWCKRNLKAYAGGQVLHGGEALPAYLCPRCESALKKADKVG